MDKNIRYTVTQAEKLLMSLRELQDFSNFLVHDPGAKSGIHTEIPITKWVDWYKDETEYMGQNSIEAEVLSLLYQINSKLNINGNRAIEMMRYLLNAVDNMQMKIEDLESKYEPKQQPIIEKEQPLLTEEMDNISENNDDEGEEDLDEV